MILGITALIIDPLAFLESHLKQSSTLDYEQLAEILARDIEKGKFAQGIRMPPVRTLAAQNGVSTWAALQAYRLLQERGILIARPQAGFYVAASRSRTADSQLVEACTAYRYEQLAQFIVGMIENGTLASGMRLPSVRAVGKQHHMSISTVLQAYRLLEERGLVTARAQSGFYVAAAQSRKLALPSVSRLRSKASTVSINNAVAALLEHASNSALVPLGCAVPDSVLLQSNRLDLALARVARQQGARYNVYDSPCGDFRLRREIAKRALQSPDDVIITNGCTEAVTLALTSVAKPSDTIAIESPSYFGHLHTLEMLGLKALEIPTDPSYGINLDALDRLLNKESVAACILSSSFSNPLGSLMPEAEKRKLIALLAQHAVPLIEDDVYGDIHFTRERPKPFIALDSGANTIYCNSFSKSLAPGYHVGWIVPGRFARQVMDRKRAFSLCNPILPQVAIADFLASGSFDAHLRRLRRLLQENMLNMTRIIELSFPSETRVSRPVGGFSLWVELPKGCDSRTLFDEALQQGICFAPGDVFSASRRFRNCLRLSAGSTWNERIEAGVRRLGELASKALK